MTSKANDIVVDSTASEIPESTASNDHAEAEVFDSKNGVDFRTVGWIRAAMFCIKMTFATGVLSIPGSLYTLGAVAGTIFVVIWCLLNTYLGYIQGTFKITHPSMHTIIDAAYISMIDLGYSKRTAMITKEITGVLYMATWILCSGASMLGLTIAINAVSRHATCTVLFGSMAYFVVCAVASIRRIHRLGWIAWLGFFSITTAVMIVVIAVTIPDRPTAAPQTGDFELGFSALPPAETTFAAAWAASLAIFSSSSNTCGFVPVISEMRRPQEFFKALYACMAWVTSAYLAFSLVVYAYCGKWVASPALGSAGPTIKIIAYAIAIPGMIAGSMICVHIAAKSLFVRLLKGSHHLTESTATHWVVWLSCTFGTGLIGWILSEAIPFFGSLVSLIGALGFGPLGICIPAVLWFALEKRKTGGIKLSTGTALHGFLFVLGLFVTIGGTYANVVEIIQQYEEGAVSAPFTCADNSGTVG